MLIEKILNKKLRDKVKIFLVLMKKSLYLVENFLHAR